MRASTKKQIPKFRSEEDERKFWSKSDSTEFIDWGSAQKRKFPQLKPSQSLLKVFLAERLEKERR